MSVSPIGANAPGAVKAAPQDKALTAEPTQTAVAGNEAVTPTQPAPPSSGSASQGEPGPGDQPAASLAPTKSDAQAEDQATASAVNELNNLMQSLDRSLEFAFEKDVNRTVVTIRDSSTQDVIKQFPSESAIELARNLQDQIASLEDTNSPALNNKEFSGELGMLLNIQT